MQAYSSTGINLFLTQYLGKNWVQTKFVNSFGMGENAF